MFIEAAETGRPDIDATRSAAIENSERDSLTVLARETGIEARGDCPPPPGLLGIYTQLIDCANGNGMSSNINAESVLPTLARDDFELPWPIAIDKVLFYGWHFDGGTFCDSSNVESFRIRIFEKVDGGACGCDVGDLVGERIFSMAEVVDQNDCIGIFGQQVYRYRVEFPDDPIVLSAGEYLLEIAANLVDPDGCGFLWQQTDVDTGCVGHTVDRVNGACIQSDFGDAAFELEGGLLGVECGDCVTIPSWPFSSTFDNFAYYNSCGPSGSCNAESAIGMNNDAWFCWTPDESCSATLEVDYDVEGVGYDGLTAVYRGPDCASLTEIACANDPEPSVITFTAIAGETYWFQIGTWGTTDGGGLTTLDLDCEPLEPCPSTLLVSAGGPDNDYLGPSSLYRVDPQTGDATLIGPIGFNAVTGLDFAPDGTLYGTARSEDEFSALLITIDPSTGAGTLVGEIATIFEPGGFSFLYEIAFDHAGVLYATEADLRDSIYIIDPSTAEPTLVGPTGLPLSVNTLAADNYGGFLGTTFGGPDPCLVQLDRAAGAGECVPGTVDNIPILIQSLDVCRASGAIYGAQGWITDSTIVRLDRETGLPLEQVPTVDNIAGLCIEDFGPPNNCNGGVGVLFDNGSLNFASALLSVIDGPYPGDPPSQSADDFALGNASVINDVHWTTAEIVDTPLDWTGQVRVEIYGAPVGSCLAEAEPIASLTVPDDGGNVIRTFAGPFLGLDDVVAYRYDVTGISIALPAGEYFLSLAPVAAAGTGGSSFWATSRDAFVGDALFGCESIWRGEGVNEDSWTPSGLGYDLNFQLTFCDAVPTCPEDLTGDSQVNADDLFQLLGAWGACPGCAEDLTGDDQVNADDLFQLLGAWGAC